MAYRIMGGVLTPSLATGGCWFSYTVGNLILNGGRKIVILPVSANIKSKIFLGYVFPKINPFYSGHGHTPLSGNINVLMAFEFMSF